MVKRKNIAIIIFLIMVINLAIEVTVSAYSYDVEAAMSYAQNHWNDGQGECAEFVSRCVMAGGLFNKVYYVTGGIRGTYGCFNAVCDASGLPMVDLTLDANGNARYSDNSSILARGDVVLQWCHTHEVSPHIMICGGYNSDGVATFYAHNAAKNNETYNWRHNTSYQHTTSCNMGAKVIHISGLSGGMYVTPQKQEPVIGLSTDTVNLDQDNLSCSVNISLSGDLPNKYSLNFSCNSSVSIAWGGWSGNNNTLILTSNGSKLTNSIGELKLLDGDGNVLKTRNITINVKGKAYAKISFSKDEITLKCNSKKSDTVYVYFNGENVDENASATCEVADGLTYSWGRFENGMAPLTISINGYPANANAVIIKILDENKNPYDTKKFRVYVEDDEPRVAFEDESEINLSKNRYISIFYYLENYDDACSVSVNCPDDVAWKWGKDGAIDVRAMNNTPRHSELEIIVRDFNNNFITSAKKDLYFSGNNSDDDGISVFINNQALSFDVPPMIINDRTMVPMRAIFEALGADVSWDNDTQTAIGILHGDVIKIKVGENYIEKNGEKIYIDSPAIIIHSRTLVPVRAIAESFDCYVDWNDKWKEVLVERK